MNRAREERNLRTRVFLGGERCLIDAGGWRRGSWRGRASGGHHRAASPIGRLKTTVFLGGSHLSVIYRNGMFGRAPVGLDVGLRWWASIRWRFFFFFYFYSFSFSFSIFYFGLLTWVWILFCRFELRSFSGFYIGWFLSRYTVLG
jgi:hypothetical protein